MNRLCYNEKCKVVCIIPILMKISKILISLEVMGINVDFFPHFVTHLKTRVERQVASEGDALFGLALC